MLVVTTLIKVVFLIDVGLLKCSSVFLVGLVVVISVMEGLVVVVMINYCWWLWQSSWCGGGEGLCKGCSCNSCRRAAGGMCTMCCKVFDKGGCGGGGGGSGRVNFGKTNIR